MGSQKDQQSDEDIPSDFFDDFNKEDFIQGLSVIDSWNDDDGFKRRAPRIDAQAVESVKDLRELIGDGKDEERRDETQRRRRRESLESREPREPRHSSSHRDVNKHSSRDDPPRSGSRSRLDDYIKPGSRRDPNKTNEAIRRDKEVKVKEHIAKRLDSTSDDLRPPGTELEDFFDCKPQETKKILVEETKQETRRTRSRSRERRRRESPGKYRRRSPRRSPLRSPIRTMRRRPSPHHYSPQRRNLNRHMSPIPLKRRLSPVHLHRPIVRRSPYRRSPYRRSPRKERRSRSPYRSPIRRSRSRSRSRSRGHHDSFLYPREPQPPPIYSQPTPYPEPIPYGGPMPVYPGVPGVPASSGFPYAANAGYSESFNMPYEYGVPAMPVGNIPIPVPQPVPAPNPALAPAPVMNPSHAPLPSPVGPPVPAGPLAVAPTSFNTSNDPLAQLVAEGKLSKEDYLKLAPNKGKSAKMHGAKAPMDTKTRIEVLNRCHDALAKLGQLKMPSRLVMNNNLVKQEPLSLAPKFCSPLKRQTTVEYNFTKPGASAASVFNKRLIEGIIRVFGLKNVIARPKKKTPKNMKDAAVQTTKPYCDVCEIRDSTKFYDASTSIDQDQFCSAVHTQVVEQDLVSSKAVFNPSGSIADGAPISIAHMTPAQLVSQLAARAKTLKQTDNSQSSSSNQYQRFPHNYEYDGRGGQHQQYQNNYNYRY